VNSGRFRSEPRNPSSGGGGSAPTTRPEIEPPRDLEAATFDIDGEEFLLLTFPADASDLANLTESEREVATELLRGKSYREVARIRGTKVGTVANQVRSIFRKLGIRSRSELARKRAP